MSSFPTAQLILLCQHHVRRVRKDGASPRQPSRVGSHCDGEVARSGCTTPRSPTGEMLNNIINNVLVVVLWSKQL